MPASENVPSLLQLLHSVVLPQSCLTNSMERTISDYSTRSTVHVPKLKVRATSDDTTSIATVSIASIDSSHRPSRDRSLNSRPANRPLSGAPSGVDSRRSSIISQTTQQSAAADKATKKKGFFSTLFSGKEPSSQALATYEKQLRTAGSLKDGGRLAASNLAGVSSAKLPGHVPKTNSRWDGNPATASKIKEKDSNLSDERLQLPSRESFSHRSLPSSGSDSLRPSMRRAASRGTLSAASIYTSHSDGSRNQLAEFYGWEVAPSPGDIDTGPSTPSLKAASLKSLSTTSVDIVNETSPAPPPPIPDGYVTALRDHASSPHQVPSHSNSPALTPRDELPLTPLGTSPLHQTGSVHSDKNAQASDEADQVDPCQAVPSPQDPASAVTLMSDGVDVLGPLMTAQRKTKAVTANEQREHTAQEPKSILKKQSAYCRDDDACQDAALDSLFSQKAVLDYYHGPHWKKKMGVHTVRRGQRHPVPNEHGNDGKTSPSPEGSSRSQRRKSLVGMLKP